MIARLLSVSCLTCHPRADQRRRRSIGPQSRASSQSRVRAAVDETLCRAEPALPPALSIEALLRLLALLCLLYLPWVACLAFLALLCLPYFVVQTVHHARIPNMAVQRRPVRASAAQDPRPPSPPAESPASSAAATPVRSKKSVAGGSSSGGDEAAVGVGVLDVLRIIGGVVLLSCGLSWLVTPETSLTWGWSPWFLRVGEWKAIMVSFGVSSSWRDGRGW